LLQQARELQASPAFNEYRRRRQVVEHRIARLVLLGIRQAHSFGRTKTLFQVCLAAAVANLTLLAPFSNPPSMTEPAWSLTTLAVLLVLSSTRWARSRRFSLAAPAHASISSCSLCHSTHHL
jgi:hypothetical protein